jgi:hypothetical protein
MTAARCVTEDDGYHKHEYRTTHDSGRSQTITVHLHTWTAEHLARWPDAKPVDVTVGGYFSAYEVVGKYDTLAEAWVAHGTGDIPAVTCRHT